MKEIKEIYRKNYKEIISFAKQAERLWEDRIYRCFGKEDFVNLKFRKYMAPEGGYRITVSQYANIDKRFHDFFKDKIKIQNGFVYFRGYDYYASDKVVHLSKNNLNNMDSMIVLMKRWKEYKMNISFVMKLNCLGLGWAEYLAVLSFLEWIWNDLSSMAWIALKMCDEKFENEIMCCVNKLSSVIIACSYDYIMQSEYHQDYSKQLDILSELFAKEDSIFEKIIEYIKIQDEYVFRAMREGDQFWMVLVNFEIKLLPWIKQNNFKKILMLNNAFGGINIGYFIKYLCDIDVDVLNICVSVHEEEMKRYVRSYNSYIKDIKDEYDCIMVIDDSIYTGRSVKKIKKVYSENADKIFCLPMTYDVSTYFNHPEEMDFERDALKSVLEAEHEVRLIGGMLTPARSYWAYKKREVGTSKNQEFEKNINGSDILIRILWNRFEKEIMNEQN